MYNLVLRAKSFLHYLFAQASYNFTLRNLFSNLQGISFAGFISCLKMSSSMIGKYYNYHFFFSNHSAVFLPIPMSDLRYTVEYLTDY